MQEQEISIFPEETVVYATFGQRFWASLLDGLILLIPSMLIGRFVGGSNIIMEIVDGDLPTSSIIGQLCSVVMSILYYAILESGNAQATVGKQALGLKVTDLNGEKITTANAVGRYMGKYISAIILFFGYFMMTWDPKNQTLHDKMAKTLVVKKVPSYRP